jgi:hypothetical protein
MTGVFAVALGRVLAEPVAELVVDLRQPFFFTLNLEIWKSNQNCVLSR